LTEVTHVVSSDGINYIRIDMDMETFIRQVLYGIHHDILNLHRSSEGTGLTAHLIGTDSEIKGPICCEAQLGPVEKGDLLLITNTGILPIHSKKPFHEHYLNARKMCPVPL